MDRNKLRIGLFKTKQFLKPAGTLFNNNRWDSAPYFIWLVALVLTQWHRATIWPESRVWTEATMTYATPLVLSMMIAWYGVANKLDTKVTFAALGTFGISLWMLFATTTGLSLPIFITGIALTTGLGIPFWLASAHHKVDVKKALNPPRVNTPALVSGPKQQNVFEDVAWLRGGEWGGPDIPTLTGSLRRLKLPDGSDARAFCATRVGGMANVLRLGPDDVELVEVAGSGHYVDVYSHVRDVLQESTTWPQLERSSLSILEPIPIGLMRDGQIKYLDLLQKHLLVGGESGSGKSNIITMIAATAILDPDCDLWLMDGKKTELYPYRSLAVGYVQDDIDDGLAMLHALQSELSAAQDIMTEMGIRTFLDSDGAIRPKLLIIDELARYLRNDDREKVMAFQRALSDLLDRGRSAGLMIVAVTQVPSKRLLTGDMKRGFTHRIALRVVDTDSSEMILDRRIPDASTIPIEPEYTGYGYIKEGGQPRKFRAFWVPDVSIKTVVVKGLEPNKIWELSAGPRLKELVAANGAPTFPDGTAVPLTREALWDEITSEPQTVAVLADAVGVSKVTARKTLQEWAKLGYITMKTVGNTTLYSK